MNNLEHKTTKTNITKLLFGIGISTLFVVMGVYLFEKPETTDSSYPMNKVFGIANIVFFGFIILFSIKKIVTNKKI